LPEFSVPLNRHKGRRIAQSAYGEGHASIPQAMNRRDFEFTIMQVEPGLWQWQFRIGETLSTGKAPTKIMVGGPR
jgi:hypothetical protein